MLRFLESFDHHVTADLSEKWSSAPAGPSIIAASGRRGTHGLRITTTAALTRSLDAQATWILGVAFLTTILPANNTPILGLLDGGTNQCDLRLNVDGTLSVTRNGTALTDGTSTLALSAGQFSFIEWKVTIADSIAANSCQVRVNGALWLTVATGQDTKNTANASANGIRLGRSANPGTGVEWFYDDLYVCDGQGSVNNDFLGDCRCDALFPNGDGDTVQFSRSAGSTNYENVDEAAPNDDTDYNQSNTVGHRDLLHFQNLSPLTDPAIFGVQVLINAKKTDAGARGIGLPVKSGSTVSAGPDQALGTSYAYYRRLLEQDPDTAAAWSEAGVNALQAGVEVTS